MSDLTERESAALDALGYTEEWLRAGLLDSALLAEQFERLQSGGTKKTARYRAQAASAWLAGESALTDEQIDAFLGVVRADSKLSHATIAELIQSQRINLEQLERIARSDEKLMRHHEALIRRTYLMRQMESGVTDEHMVQVIEYKDAAVQTSLIRDSRLARKHAELLAKRGANSTIREKARKWSQDKQFWRSGGAD
ncbi:MAG: hypothetical protein AAEJ52_19680 [Myxococcota bacterium]